MRPLATLFAALATTAALSGCVIVNGEPGASLPSPVALITSEPGFSPATCCCFGVFSTRYPVSGAPKA